MIRHLLIVVALSAIAASPEETGGGAGPARQPQSVKALYAEAQAREQALRTAWAGPTGNGATAPDLGQVRAVIAAYETVVRAHPTSGYADNALWQAAGLSSEAFARFREDRDREKAIWCYAWLADQYPGSPFVARARSEAQRLRTETGTPEASRASSSATKAAAPSLAGSAASAPAAAPGSGASKAATERPATSALATLTDVQRLVFPHAVRVTMQFDREVAHHEEEFQNPARLALDFPGTRTTPRLTDATLNFGDDVVPHVRLGRHANSTTRVVLDLDGAASHTIFTLYNPFRLVVDFERGQRSNPASPSAAGPPFPPAAGTLPSSAAPMPPTEPGKVPIVTIAADPVPILPPENVRVEQPGMAADPPLPAWTTAASSLGVLPHAAGRDVAALVAAGEEPPPAERTATYMPAAAGRDPAIVSATRGRGFSMARQLGLGVSRIVIDPGHGGHDPGAEGPGISEARVVLDVALKLEKLLQKQPGIEVVLTRRTDQFVPLEERIAIANREQADLFISIHANAHKDRRIRGVETYFLSFASTPYAAAVAARENSASGKGMNSLPAMVKAIALSNKLDESREFAATVDRAMVQRLRSVNKNLRDLGVKRAPFVVLIGAEMPSILVEISFITNPGEGQLLRGENYRQRIAEALLDGVQRYQQALKKAQAISH